MRGLDPRIHDEAPHGKHYNFHHVLKLIMDCRVKPGNDSGEALPSRPNCHRFTVSRTMISNSFLISRCCSAWPSTQSRIICCSLRM